MDGQTATGFVLGEARRALYSQSETDSWGCQLRDYAYDYVSDMQQAPSSERKASMTDGRTDGEPASVSPVALFLPLSPVNQLYAPLLALSSLPLSQPQCSVSLVLIDGADERARPGLHFRQTCVHTTKLSPPPLFSDAD